MNRPMHHALPDGRGTDVRDAARRARVRLYASAFCVDALWYGFAFVLPVHAQTEFGASAVEFGALGTVAGIVYALMCLVVGRLSDRFGSRPLYLGGLAVALAVALPIAFFARWLPWLYASSALLGASLACYWPPLERELRFITPWKDLSKAVGSFNCTWGAGICLGVIFGASFYTFLGFRWGTAVCAILGAAALALVAPRLRSLEPLEHKDDSRIAFEISEADGGNDPRLTAFFIRISWIANFAAYFAINGVNYVITDVREKLGFSVLWMGAFLLAMNLSRVAAFFALRHLNGWHYSLRWLVSVQAFAVAALAALAALALLAPSEQKAAFLVFLPALGALGGLTYFSSFYYGLRVASREGANSGIHEFFLSFGAMLGPLVCGAAADRYPSWPGVMFVVCAAVILASLIAVVAVARLASSRTEIPRVDPAPQV